MCISIVLPIRFSFAERHAENSVRPLELHTADAVLAVQRIEVEEIVLDAPRFVVAQRVDDNAVGAQIRHVGERIVACRFLHVDDL